MRYAITLALLLLMGCASNRYLTDAQDKELRRVCEKGGGCVIMPKALHNRLLQMLDETCI